LFSTSKDPIPIALMVRELGSGGIERDVTKLALGLDRTRFTPYVVSYQANGFRHEELRRADVPILQLRVSSFKSPAVLSRAVEFAWFLKRQRIAILHAFDSTAVFGVPLARLVGVPAVLASTLGHRSLLDQRTRRQFRFVDCLVDTVVVNCKAMREHLVRDFSIPGHRIELCYNGVDTKEFHPPRLPATRPACVAGATLVVGTVCVLRPEKGLEILQEAFAKARRFFPDIRLLIVGSGPELERVERNSARLGIGDACFVIPAVPEVAPLLHCIDIFVSSSHSEAFSNSILEAMASGCCVVASRVGGTPELITDRERGLLFTAGDAAELERKLVELIADPTLRTKLANSAAEFAARSLNVDKNISRAMGIYDAVLCRKKAAKSPGQLFNPRVNRRVSR
jgi:glycosyltransferase involved in cell wall biosynthesis